VTVDARTNALGLRGRTHDVLNYVAGEWREAASGARVEMRSPGDLDDQVSSACYSGAADVRAAVAAAEAARQSWRDLGPIARGSLVLEAARVLRSRAEDVAVAITREHGKLQGEAAAEVERTVAVLEFLAGEGRRLRGSTEPADDPDTIALTRREPIGVVGLVTPWNFPLAIPAWKLSAALVAGCTTVLKPSPLTPLTAKLLVDCFADAGVPSGAVNMVHGGREAGLDLVADPGVCGISFTGSVEVGRAINVAGSRRFLKTQLEMGGKNAALVLEDADLDAATDAIVTGAFGQCGQRCSATSRVVVDRRVHDDLVERLVRRAQLLTVGHGFDPDADMGPVITEERLHACLESVAAAAEAGASVATGGSRIAAAGSLRGWYMEPTVLDAVEATDPVAQDEVFGPVLSVIQCDGLNDGLGVVNGVRFGMAAAVFTRDVSAAMRALDRVEVGMAHINRPGVGAYPHMPHVGTKESQHGPPECSPHVWDFFTEWRTCCISY
jgi:aldehyde dehydrogenase (NAD+)